jgi:hypothetical protein
MLCEGRVCVGAEPLRWIAHPFFLSTVPLRAPRCKNNCDGARFSLG